MHSNANAFLISTELAVGSTGNRDGTAPSLLAAETLIASCITKIERLQEKKNRLCQTKVHWWKNKRKNRMHLTVITWRLLEHNTHHTHSRIIRIYSDIKDTNAKNYTFIWELLIKEIHENHAEIQEITRSEWVSKRREKCKCNCNQSFVDQRSFRCVPGNTS